MIFKSPYIEKEFSIPDAKLPAADRFSLKCPFTKKSILFIREGERFIPTAAEKIPSEPAPPKKVLDLPAVEPDAFPPGAKTVFLGIMDDTWCKSSEEFFRSQGYYLGGAESVLEGIAKLRLNNYDIVVVEEDGDSQDLLDEVASWPGRKRRSVNFIVIGGEAASFDQSVGFYKGVNTYLNTGDKAKAGELLEEALTGYELYYRLLDRAENSDT